MIPNKLAKIDNFNVLTLRTFKLMCNIYLVPVND